MKNSTFITDILVLIGVLPIERPVEIKQVEKRMGYPVNYLISFSQKEIEQMSLETEKLMNQIN